MGGKFAVWIFLALGSIQSQARGDDSFRCGSHWVELGESSASVEHACGPPREIHRTAGRVQNGDGTSMFIEYETWTYDLGPVTFSRLLVFSDGVLTSITTGEYGR
jgi:hypothetical protein